MREITTPIGLIVMLWCSQSRAGSNDQCLGKCDPYENYDCNPFFGICEPCVSEDDSPKCKEYFDSMRKEPTKSTPQEPTETTTQQINDTVLPELMAVTESNPDETAEIRDGGRNHLGQNERGRNHLDQKDQQIDLKKDGGGKEEKHTNVIIIVATACMVTLCVVGTVFRLHRRYRSPPGRGTTTVMESGENELLDVVVHPINGAEPEEETTL
ncbi:uncharacterized protein LOC100891507 [Strongylocentrotus purpuratus]|uniref:Uncharacterized protein n=1 Tax=Strongylocentrotus purpuratus TaxID=7668 RepID=A0A7M7GGD6_STRPU|nr:uncharacterized protein LOC100891507 [Strongylocentrotus purpuratus]